MFLTLFIVNKFCSIGIVTSLSTSSGVFSSYVVTTTAYGKFISGNNSKGNLVNDTTPNKITISIPIKTVIGLFTLYLAIFFIKSSYHKNSDRPVGQPIKYYNIYFVIVNLFYSIF